MSSQVPVEFHRGYKFVVELRTVGVTLGVRSEELSGTGSQTRTQNPGNTLLLGVVGVNESVCTLSNGLPTYFTPSVPSSEVDG